MNDTQIYKGGLDVRFVVETTGRDEECNDRTVAVGDVGVVTAKGIGGEMLIDVEVASGETVTVIYDPAVDGNVGTFVVPADEKWLRERSIADIENLYGLTGNDSQTEFSKRCVIDIVHMMGTDALTTPALAKIAAMHRFEDIKPRRVASPN